MQVYLNHEDLPSSRKRNVMVLGLPRLGIYSKIIKAFFEDLGCQIVQPSKVSQEIIAPGVMNSADMVCYPFKTTLGQEIWALEHGATDLIIFSTHGLCRFKHFHQLQEHTLRNLGYEFTMHTLSTRNFITKLMRITGASPPRLIKVMLRTLSQIKEVELRTYHTNSDNSLRIGIVGEVYCCWESDINFDIVRKLQRMGVNVDLSVTLSHFIKKALKLDFFEKREEKREAKHLLSEEIGGHGFDSIYNTIFYGKSGFNGVIHLLPLSCMPESSVEPLVNMVAEKYNIPLYRFPLDESSFSVGFDTRLSTFVSMIKRKREKEGKKKGGAVSGD
ncbi:hypothetical protein ES703_115278 [subsurface metagenome]